MVSEAYANPGLSQVSESYFGSLKDQANHAPSLLTSDLDSQSKQHTNSLMKAPVSDNMPNDVPARQNSLGLWKYLDDDISLDDNPSSGILPTEQVTGEIPFQITEISSEWAYCTEDTKVKPPPPFPSYTKFPCFFIFSSAVQFSWEMLYFTFSSVKNYPNNCLLPGLVDVEVCILEQFICICMHV